MEQVSLDINGKKTQVSIEKNWTLLFVLREVLGLTGAKCGCSTGDCGACKVIIDGEAVNSCLVLARNLEGKKIETIEAFQTARICTLFSRRLSTPGQYNADTAPREW